MQESFLSGCQDLGLPIAKAALGVALLNHRQTIGNDLPRVISPSLSGYAAASSCWARVIIAQPNAGHQGRVGRVADKEQILVGGGGAGFTGFSNAEPGSSAGAGADHPLQYGCHLLGDGFW